MNQPPTHDRLAAALAAAGAAHHDYESRFLDGVRDEMWPGWYAAYALGRVGDFISPTTLAGWLEEVPTDGVWSRDAASHVLERMAGP